MSLHQAFSLIDLLVTIAIMVILAAVAMPVYRSYTVRSYITEALQLIEQPQEQVTKEYITNSELPASTAAYSITSKRISGVTWTRNNINDGFFTITFSSNAGELQNLQINLYGTVSNGALNWQCKNDAPNPIASQYLPTACQ